jgi:hypothetical protein
MHFDIYVNPRLALCEVFWWLQKTTKKALFRNKTIAQLVKGNDELFCSDMLDAESAGSTILVAT